MYKFDPGADPAAVAFRSIAANQLDEALADLGRDASSKRSLVHDARRRCKKLRALLRLVRPVFPDFRQENAALRDAAGLLSHLRDAEVMRQTVDDLASASPNAALSRISARLTAEPAPEPSPEQLEEFRSRLSAVRARVDGWHLEEGGRRAVLPGLRRTYADNRAGLRAALHSGDPEDFHEWRKANKNHGFHLGLMKKTAPDVIAGEVAVVDRLSEMLGTHHDLTILLDAVEAAPDRFGTPEDVGELRSAITDRRERVEAEAISLGLQILAEKPGALADRFARYWNNRA